MGDTSAKVELHKFHLQCLKTIDEINARYPKDPHFFSMFGFIKAKEELERLVNEPAHKYGLKYDLKKRHISLGANLGADLDAELNQALPETAEPIAPPEVLENTAAGEGVNAPLALGTPIGQGAGALDAVNAKQGETEQVSWPELQFQSRRKVAEPPQTRFKSMRRATKGQEIGRPSGPE